MKMERNLYDYAWFLQQAHLAFRHLQLASVQYIGRPDYAAAIKQAHQEAQKEDRTYIRVLSDLTTFQLAPVSGSASVPCSQYYVLDPQMKCIREGCGVTFGKHAAASHDFEGVTDDGRPFHGR